MNRRAFTLCLACTVAAASLACGDGAESGLWVEGAQSANAEADRAIAAEDWDAARRVLRAAVDRPVPAGVARDDARVVKQDLLYRLAEVELAAGDPSAAADRADEGLNLGVRDDVFTANLLVTRGRAREALERPREAAGDYMDALEINEKLLSDALGE